MGVKILIIYSCIPVVVYIYDFFFFFFLNIYEQYVNLYIMIDYIIPHHLELTIPYASISGVEAF